MKINKILAAGIAATLAVTSLSAVVGAEQQTRSYDLYYSSASSSNEITVKAEVNRDIADHLNQVDVQTVVFEDLASNIKGLTGSTDIKSADWGQTVNEVSLTVTGFTGTQSVTKTFKLANTEIEANRAWNKRNGTWYIVVLDKKTPIYHDGEFASFFFDRITDMTLTAKLGGYTEAEGVYGEWTNSNKNTKAFQIGKIAIMDKIANTTINGNVVYEYGTYATNKEDLAKVQASAAQQEAITLEKLYYAGQQPLANANNPIQTVPSTTQLFQTVTSIPGTSLIAAEEVTAVAGDSILRTDEKATDVVTKDGLKKLYKVTTYGVTGALVAPGVATTTVYTDTCVADATDALAAGDKVKAYVVTAANKTRTVMAVDLNDYDGDATYNATNAANNTEIKPANYVILNKDGTYSTPTKSIFGNGEFAVNVSTLSKANSTANLLAYAFAKNGWYVSKNAYGTVSFQPGSPATAKTNAWLPVTTVVNSHRKEIDYKGATTIYRDDVWKLSVTGAHTSQTQNGTNTSATKDDINTQTYVDAMTAGTGPVGFAGLAGQVAEFFNKQDNGTITFNFTSAAAAGSSGAWNSGIPSTEVGLIGSGAGTVTSNFALFFNYETTTGMMFAPAKADLTAGTVTFDISDYLNKSGTLTMATLHDIYYGLNVGYKKNAWTDAYGMYVTKVDLAYDDAPAAADADAAAADDDATVADDDDAAAVVDADDDDDDDTALIEDDDDDDDDDATIIADDDDDDTDDDDIAAVITDDDEDDTAAAGTVDVVTPAAQDSNPATGVGLAVIPAIVAAAAMAISKKRK